MKSPLLIPAMVLVLVDIGASVTDVQPVALRCALVAAVAFIIVGWSIASAVENCGHAIAAASVAVAKKQAEAARASAAQQTAEMGGALLDAFGALGSNGNQQ